MSRKRLRDDDGNEYDVDVPDDDNDDSSSDDDENTIYLDEEDIEWLKRKRLEENESQRKGSQSSGQKRQTPNKTVKIRAKQSSSTSRESSQGKSNGRRRVLRIA